MKYVKSKTNLFENIPLNTNGRIFRVNPNVKKDPLSSVRNHRKKANICKYSGFPTHYNRKEVHPKHIAREGYCPCCGRLV